MSQDALVLWAVSMSVSVESVKTLSKTRWTIFSTSANLHPQCRVTARQQQLFSFDCKSAQKRVCLRQRKQPPGYQRLFVWGAHQSGFFNIYFTSCIIINDHILLFWNDTSPRVRKPCVLRLVRQGVCFVSTTELRAQVGGASPLERRR